MVTSFIWIILCLNYADAFVFPHPVVRSRFVAGCIGMSTKMVGHSESKMKNSTVVATEAFILQSFMNSTMADLVREDLERINTISSTEGEKKVSPNNDGDAAKPKYNWNMQWYPIQAVDTVDKTKPQKAYLLGMEFVIWYSESDGEWNAFEDACPHRQGPLSEGRIEQSNDDGSSQILCSYHGWQFDSKGSCASLPYSKEGPLRSRHEGNCRAQCQSFPTRVENGLLFVFPQTGKDAKLQASLTPITGIRELAADSSSSSSWRYKIPAGVRDFPCGWDTMVENTLDPAHFCAAHHGTLGNRYTDPKHYSQKVVQPIPRDITSNEPFVVEGDFGTLEFQPPCLVRYTPDNPSMPFGGKMTIATYCVPTRPGWVRPLATVITQDRPPFWWLQKDVKIAEVALEIFMNPLTPAWVGHILSSIVLHQDAGILYYQHRNFQRKGYLSQNAEDRKSYRELSYMPNESDMGVAMFRQWLQKSSHGVGCTFDPSYRDDPTEKVDIFDMWHHTSQCKYCSDAYRRLERARKAAWVLFYVSILASPVLTTTVANADTTMTISPWTSLVVGIVSASIALVLEKFNGMFRRYEVCHTDDSIIDKLPFFK